MSYQKTYDNFSRHGLLEDIQQALQQQYGKEGLRLLFWIKRIEGDALLKNIRNTLCDKALEENFEPIWSELLILPKKKHPRLLDGKANVQDSNVTPDYLSNITHDLSIMTYIFRRIVGLDDYCQPLVKLDDDIKTMLDKALSMIY